MNLRYFSNRPLFVSDKNVICFCGKIWKQLDTKDKWWYRSRMTFSLWETFQSVAQQSDAYTLLSFYSFHCSLIHNVMVRELNPFILHILAIILQGWHRLCEYVSFKFWFWSTAVWTSRPEKRTVSRGVYSNNLCGRKMGAVWDFIVKVNETGTLIHPFSHPYIPFFSEHLQMKKQ